MSSEFQVVERQITEVSLSVKVPMSFSLWMSIGLNASMRFISSHSSDPLTPVAFAVALVRSKILPLWVFVTFMLEPTNGPQSVVNNHHLLLVLCSNYLV